DFELHLERQRAGLDHDRARSCAFSQTRLSEKRRLDCRDARQRCNEYGAAPRHGSDGFFDRSAELRQLGTTLRIYIVADDFKSSDTQMPGERASHDTEADLPHDSWDRISFRRPMRRAPAASAALHAFMLHRSPFESFVRR